MSVGIFLAVGLAAGRRLDVAADADPCTTESVDLEVAFERHELPPPPRPTGLWAGLRWRQPPQRTWKVTSEAHTYEARTRTRHCPAGAAPSLAVFLTVGPGPSARAAMHETFEAMRLSGLLHAAHGAWGPRCAPLPRGTPTTPPGGNGWYT